MQILTHAPAGPWPEFGTCPCCGQPWPNDDLFVLIDPSPFNPRIPEEFSEEPPESVPSPFAVEEAPAREILAVSGVGAELLILLRDGV